MVLGEAGAIPIGEIHYEKKGKDPVRTKDVSYDWLIFDTNHGGHYLEFSVHINNDKKYSKIKSLFWDGAWQADSEFLELNCETKA